MLCCCCCYLVECTKGNLHGDEVISNGERDIYDAEENTRVLLRGDYLWSTREEISF